MRILALSDWFPYPPDNGARMRTHNLLRQLAQGHEIVLLSFIEDAPSAWSIEAVQTYCREITTVPSRSYRHSQLKSLLGFFQPRPRDVIATYSREMERFVKEKLADEPFDAVVAFAIGPGGGTAPYVRGMKEIPRIIEDLELSILKDRIAIQPRWYQRVRLRLTWWKLRNYVARSLQDMDGCTVASAEERNLLLSILPSYQSLEVIPNGVDLSIYNGDFGLTEPDTLVFPGALTYKANLWAIKFFLEEIFPAVKAQRPGVKLYVTGHTDGVPLEELPCRDGVFLTGYLDDIRPRIAQSTACVVPMTLGGGTRLKILEAMALGTPVVSTSKGAEGLEVMPDRDILIADEPAAFAEAVLRLLNDGKLRDKLAQNGRRLVREKYDWKTIGAKFDVFLREVVAAKGLASLRN